MGNEGEITLEEALKMLAAAKLQIAEQQQELKSKDAVISEKDLKISTQISLLNQKNKELEAEKKRERRAANRESSTSGRTVITAYTQILLSF